MGNLKFKEISSGIKSQPVILARIFSKKIDTFLVIEINHKVSILDVSVKNGTRINFLKSIPLLKDNRDDSILNAIKDFIKENHIEHKKAILNSSLDSTVVKRIQIPLVPDSELTNAIKWQIKEDIAFDLSNAIIDYSIIKKTVKEDGSKILDIVCIAAKEEEIKQQVLLLKQAGLDCLAVNISPFGYAKIIDKYLLPKTDEPVAVLNIDASKCYTAVYRNSKLEFYRELPVSINKFKESLKGVLGSEKGKIELSSDEIEEIYSDVGIPIEDSIYKQKISFMQILSLQRPLLERLITEIKRSLSYYDTEYGGGTVNKVFIAGGALKIPNLDKFLAKELCLDVENIVLKDKLITAPDIDQTDLLESYASLGLVFDHEKQVNLMPYEFRSRQIEDVEKVSLRWLVFIAILLLAMSFIFTKVRIGILYKSLSNSKFHLSTLSPVKEITENLSALNNFISEIKKAEPPVGIILKKLSNLATKELFFSQLTIDCNDKSGSINGFIKTLSQNPDAILTEFISAMKTSGYFRDANIANVSKEERENSNIAVFNIKFKLN